MPTSSQAVPPVQGVAQAPLDLRALLDPPDRLARLDRHRRFLVQREPPAAQGRLAPPDPRAAVDRQAPREVLRVPRERSDRQVILGRQAQLVLYLQRLDRPAQQAPQATPDRLAPRVLYLQRLDRQAQPDRLAGRLAQRARLDPVALDRLVPQARSRPSQARLGQRDLLVQRAPLVLLQQPQDPLAQRVQAAAQPDRPAPLVRLAQLVRLARRRR